MNKMDASSEQGKAAWFVARTGIKAEQRAENALRRAGLQVFQPRFRVEYFNRRKKVWIERELFLLPRYLFVELPLPANWLGFHRLDGIEGVLGVGGAPKPIPAALVARFREAEADLEFDTTRAARLRRGEIGRTRRETAALRFRPGAVFRAASGPFAGHVGRVESVNGRGMVEGLIDILGGLTPVTFDASTLEVVG